MQHIPAHMKASQVGFSFYKVQEMELLGPKTVFLSFNVDSHTILQKGDSMFTLISMTYNSHSPIPIIIVFIFANLTGEN